jgi:diketogulonate reductase-like aldo/keto reductase
LAGSRGLIFPHIATSYLRKVKVFLFVFSPEQHSAFPHNKLPKITAKSQSKIDSAAMYGNEGPCADTIKKSDIPRNEIFFTSKIPPPLSYESAKAQIARTLAATQLPYMDLLLLHSPWGGSAGRKGAWRALVEAHEEGKVHSIGVSNFGVHHLNELEGFIKELEIERGGKGRGGVISVGQYELHPWLARPDIVGWLRERNVVIEAYSPLVKGLKMNDPILEKIAKKHDKSPAQVLVRWSLQMGFVPLPKSETLSRIEGNADVFGWELDDEDMEMLDTGAYETTGWDPTVSPLGQ